MKKMISDYSLLLTATYLVAVAITIAKFDGKIIVAISIVILGQLMIAWICYGILGLMLYYFFGSNRLFYKIFLLINVLAYMYYLKMGNNSSLEVAYLFLVSPLIQITYGIITAIKSRWW